MPFNSDTYYANKYQRQAWEALADARDIRARAARGEAYAFEVAMLPNRVKRARLMMHMSVTFRRISDSGKAHRKKMQSPAFYG